VTSAGTLNPRLQDIVDDFDAVSGQEKLQLLLEFAGELPALPERFAAHRDRLEAVPECQSPLFLAVEVDDDEIVHLFFDAPPEAPTTRIWSARCGCAAWRPCWPGSSARSKPSPADPGLTPDSGQRGLSPIRRGQHVRAATWVSLLRLTCNKSYAAGSEPPARKVSRWLTRAPGWPGSATG
jgi:hypothetical protein